MKGHNNIYNILEFFISGEVEKLPELSRKYFIKIYNNLFYTFFIDIVLMTELFTNVSRHYMSKLYFHNWTTETLDLERLMKLELAPDKSFSELTNNTFKLTDLAKKINDNPSIEIKNKPNFAADCIKFSEIDNLPTLFVIKEKKKEWIFDGNKRLIGKLIGYWKTGKYEPVKIFVGTKIKNGKNKTNFI